MTGTASPAGSGVVPDTFRAAVHSLNAVRSRAEITLAPTRPPQRLAPYSHALAATVDSGERELASARLILLHDPNGHPDWDGTLRLVVYLRAEIDAELATDPLLPAVGWSWLCEALDSGEAEATALGGTVTVTSSARFGDLASGGRADDLELRASWTPLRTDLAAHGHACCQLLSSAAGLPPVGVAPLGRQNCI